MENKKEIICNKIKCKKCGYVIESNSTNDYKKCSCGAVAVDGGKDYLKKSVVKKTMKNYQNLNK